MKPLCRWQLDHDQLGRVPIATNLNAATGSEHARNSPTNWSENREAGGIRFPCELGAERALDKPEARLGQNDGHDYPGDITDYRVSEQIEYRDSRQDIPEID